jgi:hypothetical protein
MQDLWPLKFSIQFSGAVLNRYGLSPFSLQRDNDPSLASSTLEFDSFRHQTRQKVTATATQRSVFFNRIGIVAIMLS